MQDNIIVKPFVEKQFDRFLRQGRVLFFSAPCGFGKTCVADALTEGKSVLRLSAADPDFVVPSKAGGIAPVGGQCRLQAALCGG